MKKGVIERTLKDLSKSSPPHRVRDYSGSRLTERRYEARLTQEDLAELVGVSKQTVGFWEQGRRYPGKTTLVSEWVEGIERPAAWLSLDEGDNDPARFLTYLVAALQTIAANIGEGVLG